MHGTNGRRVVVRLAAWLAPAAVVGVIGGVVGGMAGAAAGQPCEPGWLPEFSPNGVQTFSYPFAPSWIVRSAVVFDADGAGPGEPEVWIGGLFRDAGGVSAHSVARWNGRTWAAADFPAPLGLTPGVTVQALAVFDAGSGPTVYAGGWEITPSVGSPTNLVRKVGDLWMPVPGAPVGSVTSLVSTADASAGPGLYMAVQSGPVHRWTGQNWTQLPSAGRPGVVRRLVVVDPDGTGPQQPAVFAVGTPGPSAPGVAVSRWTGAGWAPMGTGWTGTVHALEVFDPDGDGPEPARLYVGGQFASVDGEPVHNLAQWNGERWVAVGEGVNSTVLALRAFDPGDGEALYIGCEHALVVGDALAGSITRYTGHGFEALGLGTRNAFGQPTPPSVHDLLRFDDEDGPALMAVGTFNLADIWPSRGAAVWTGSAWRPTGGGPPVAAPGSIHVLPDSGAAVLIGHQHSEQTPTAIWDGQEWRPLGPPIQSLQSGVRSALAWADLEDGSGPSLYLGGSNLRPIGPGLADRFPIARLDGETWIPLGEGSVTINALAPFRSVHGGPFLIAGGSFTSIDETPAQHIAAWDGSAWRPLGSGIAAGSIFALAVHDDGSGPALYAGGVFSMAGGVPAGSIARWDGASWSSVGGSFTTASGAPGTVNALLSVPAAPGRPSALYAAGDFASSGGIAVANIASWNGSHWEPLGAGLVGGVVRTLALFDEDGRGPALPALVAGGDFAQAGGHLVTAIVKWDGVSWSRMGTLSGGPYAPPPLVYSMTTVPRGEGENLIVTGRFGIAGGAPSAGLAVYGGCPRCPADYNNDGSVNSTDLSAFIQGWLSALANEPVDADFNRDGAVNSSDLSAFIAAWLAAVQGGC